jgi:hypothetical protein
VLGKTGSQLRKSFAFERLCTISAKSQCNPIYRLTWAFPVTPSFTFLINQRALFGWTDGASQSEFESATDKFSILDGLDSDKLIPREGTLSYSVFDLGDQRGPEKLMGEHLVRRSRVA